ncbi:MAG: hypothetical protein PUB21_02555 [Bacteroidales bacterium]|nr:hypothetical protein [Bacteroidales bacterium]
MENTKKDENINFKRYYIQYKKHWKWVLLSVVSAMFLAFLFLLTTKSVYQVNAHLILKDDSKGLSPGSIAKNALMQSFGSSFGFGGAGSINLDDEVMIIKSHSLLEKAVKELNLNIIYSSGSLFWKTKYYKDSPIKIIPENPVLLDTLSKAIKIIVDVDRSGKVNAKAKTGFFSYKTIGTLENATLPATINTTLGSFIIKSTPFLSLDKETQVKAYIINKSRKAELLAEEISVKAANKKANVVVLTTDNENPERSKDILNKIIELYDQDVLDEKKELISHTMNFVQDRLFAVSQELSDSEQKIEAYKKANNLSDVEVEAKIMLEKNSDFKEKLIDVSTQLNVVNMINDYLSKDENRYNLIPNGLGIEDQGLADAISSYNTALIERTRLLRNTSPNNPIFININEQIDLMRSGVLASINNVISSISITKRDLEKQEQQFLGRIKNMPTQEREFVDIKRNQLIKEQIFLYLLEKREENALNMSLARPKSKVMDYPYTMAIPIAPRPKIVILVAFVIGLLLPLGIFLWSDFMGKKILGKEKIQELTNIPILSSLDLSLNAVEKNTCNGLKKMIGLLIVKLNKLLPNKNNIIGITSGRGESDDVVLAINLAREFASLRKDTVLVDFCSDDSFSQKYFENSNAIELYDYISSDELTPEMIIRKSLKFPNLSYIVIKNERHLDNGLFYNEKLRGLLSYLKENYQCSILRLMPFFSSEIDFYSLEKQIDMLLYVCKDKISCKQDLTNLDKAVKDQLITNVQIVFNSEETDIN